MQTKEIKTMVLGPRCGKSTFLKSITGIDHNRIVINGQVVEMESTTLGADVVPYDLCINPDIKVRLNLWEVGSYFQGLGKEYCTGAKLAIIFKNNTNEHLEFEEWIPEHIPRVYVENYDTINDNNIIENISEKIHLENMY
tara:strand:- start:157 stop:576 length:420 start_codon:yes stop_codon:yes gene_type:complete